jgi:peroxiredoxin
MRQVYQNSRKGIPIKDYDAVNQMAEDIFKEVPLHPVHHYVIHLWDRKTPANALKSAALNGTAAPAIAHMWHMPGHTYSKLQRYHEAAWYQEASARVDHAHTMRYQFLPDQIHNFAHNNEWLVRTLNHIGRCNDAVSLAKNMIELPRVPKFQKKDDDSSYTSSKSSWRYGRHRLRDSLVRFEKWEELLALETTPYLKPDESSLKKADLEKFYAIAKFESGDIEGGKAILKQIKDELDSLRSGPNPKKQQSAIRSLESRFNEISVYAALNSDPVDLETAKKYLPKLKSVAKARQAYLWHRAGDHEKAVSTIQSAVNSGKNQVHPLATQVQILHAAGKTEEARKAFTKLRTVAAQADPDLPVLQRLAPIAKELEFPEDWRIATKKPDGQPAIDSLGPFRWCPPPAPDFALKDYKGKEYKLSAREGKSTLVIFYLGKGCAHCMEQLNEFAPAMDKFKAAGIDIMAISSDTPEGLAQTFVDSGDDGGKNPFPFPLLSDAGLEIFKKYRAFDDFENQTLHGTFLIDKDLNIRWRDISFEPFMYSEWMLDECIRLINL